MAWSTAAAAARGNARVRSTSKEQISAWNRWCEFIKQIEYENDQFLDNLKRSQKTYILACFAQAVREATYSKRTKQTLVAETVRGTVDNVATTFRDYDREDPRLDKDGKTARILQQQYSGYRKEDPPERQQKAAPAALVEEVTKNKATNRLVALGQLVIIAYYFAMRSCEYLKVPKQEDRQTKVIRLVGIRFNLNGKWIEHTHPQLHNSDFVSITFEDQKNGERMETITQFRTGGLILCPVRATAALVKRAWKMKGATGDTPINTFETEAGRTSQITSDDMRKALRAAVLAIGEAKLGFKAGEVGTHSLRSGAAMAMHLAEIPVYTIMIMGRWSSDAFLKYIRKQVAQFSQNIAKRMYNTQHFVHVPALERVDPLDPRTRNHPQNAQTRSNLMGSQSARRSKLSSMAMW